MSLTIQESEFTRMYTNAIKAYTNAVYIKLKQQTAGIPVDHGNRNKIKELRLILLCVGNWDQGRFTHLGHVNYLSKTQMLEVFNRIDELK